MAEGGPGSGLAATCAPATWEWRGHALRSKAAVPPYIDPPTFKRWVERGEPGGWCDRLCVCRRLFASGPQSTPTLCSTCPASVAADCRGEPLLRVRLTRLADGGCILALTLAHIVADGIHWPALLQHIAARYRQAAAGSVVVGGSSSSGTGTGTALEAQLLLDASVDRRQLSVEGMATELLGWVWDQPCMRRCVHAVIAHLHTPRRCLAVRQPQPRTPGLPRPACTPRCWATGASWCS